MISRSLTGRIVRIVQPIIRPHHLDNEHGLFLYFIFENCIGHALSFSENFLRIDAHHILCRINHVSHQDTNFVVFRLVEYLIKYGSEVRVAWITNALCSNKDVIVVHKLLDSLWIRIDRTIHYINFMLRIVAWQVVQHLHNCSLE